MIDGQNGKFKQTHAITQPATIIRITAKLSLYNSNSNPNFFYLDIL